MASAQTLLTWDPNNTQTDGSGNWDTSSSFWYNGSADTIWLNSGSAIADFGYSGGTGGTVTLTTGISADGIVFNTDPGSFTFAGTGSPTLTLGTAGITVAATDATETFGGSLAIALNGNQTWTNNSVVSSQLLSVGSAISGTSSSALTINGPGNTTLGGVISGSMSLVKSGSGTLTLNGNNTSFTGGVAITGGTIYAANSNAFGTGILTLGGGAITGTNGNPTVANPIYATASTITNLYGGNNYITYTGAITGSGTILSKNVGNGGLSNTFFDGSISGFTGTFDYEPGTGTENFQFQGSPASGNFSGSQANFIVDAGSAIVGFTAGATFQMGSLAGSSSGNLLAVGNIAIGYLNTNTTYAGTISNPTTGVTKVGTGTLTLTGNSGFTGGFTMTAGTVVIGNNGAFGTGTLTLSGGAITATNGYTISNNIAVTPGTTTNLYGYTSNPTYTGTVTGSGTIENDNLGSGLSNTFINGSISGFTGTIDYENYQGGENFQFNGSTANGNFNGSQAHFIANGNSGNGSMIVGEAGNVTFQMGDLSGSGGRITGAGGDTIQIGALNDNTTYNGSINNNGTINLTKVGTGTLTLGGTNGYTGVTTVSSGTLQFTNEVALYNNTTSDWTAPNIIVASGATAAFNVGGSNQFTAANIQTLSGLGGASNGFESGSAIGLDTTYVSNFSYGNAITNPNSGANALGLTKLGANTLTLTAANTYTGPTTVSAGTLTVSGSGTLSGTSSLSLASGTTFNYLPSSTNTLTLGAGGTLNLAAQSQIGTAFGDTIAAPGAATVSGTVFLNLSGGFTNGTPYTVLSAASGLAPGATYYAVNSSYTYTLASSATAVTITPTASLTPWSIEYWIGGFAASTAWAASDGASASNWASDSSGTPTPLVPGSSATVNFSATGATGEGTMTLGTSMSVAGAVFGDSTAITLNPDGSTLTLGSGGITVNSGSNAVTLGSGIGLSSSQSWTNNSTSTLTISGAVNIPASNGLTISGNGATSISGAISGGGAITVNTTGTATISGTAAGNSAITVSNGILTITGSADFFGAPNIGTINSSSTTAVLSIPSGTTTFSAGFGLGTGTGSRGVLDISGTAMVTDLGSGIAFGGASNINNLVTASGVINQSGGTLNLDVTGQILMAWDGGYGAYVLSGGTLTQNGSNWNIDNQTTTYGVFSQSGGTATINDSFIVNNGSPSGAIVDISGGTMVHTNGNFMTTASATGGVGVLTVRGTGYLQEQTGNFYVTNGGNAIGIVNLLTGGTIEANRIRTNSGTSTINFDGGTLKVYSTNAGTSFFTGLTNAFVYSGGVTVNTNTQNVTIGQALTAPTGYGIGADGSTIAVSSGGSGYIAPPVVTFAAPASGVQATGVAVLNSSGTVTGIIITSPGSGYASGQSVAVSFNNNSNSASEATTQATSSMTVTAGTLNSSGGLTKINPGTLILSGANTYTGGTTVTAGEIQLSGSGTLGNGGLLTVTGSGTVDINGISLTGAAAVNGISDGGANSGILTSSSGTPTLVDSITGSGNQTFSGLISGTLALTISSTGSGAQILSGANTYTGATNVQQGTLILANALNTVPTTQGIVLGSGSASGILQLGTTAGPTSQTLPSLTTSGTGGSNAVVGGSSSISTLTIANTTPETFSGALGGSATYQNNLGLTLSGGSTLNLTGASTYLGPTNVTSGTLNLTGSLGNTPVSIASGSTLSGTGNNSSTGVIGGNVRIAGGANLTLSAGNSAQSLTVGSLALGTPGGSYSSANYAALNYTLTSSGIEAVDLGPSAGPTGMLNLNSGGAYVNVTGAPVLGSFTLMNFASQIGSGSFSLSSSTAGMTIEHLGADTYTLTDNAKSLVLTITGTAVPGVAYWKGGVSMAWNDVSQAPTTNWSLDNAGAHDAGNVPAGTTDVILTATNQTGAVATTLGASTTINSLNVNSNAAGNTISADGSMLTINALADSNTDYTGAYTGNAAGTGIKIAAGAGAFTINVPLVLGGSGANQTWTNGSGNTFTVAGTSITGTATVTNLQTLTLSNTGSGSTRISAPISDVSGGGQVAVIVNSSGSGTTYLTGNNTFSGGLTLTAGSLSIQGGSSTSLGAGNVTINGGALDLYGISGVAINNLSGTGGDITSTSGTASISLTNSTANTFSGTIDSGVSGGITVAGSGSIALSGSNGFTGGTLLTQGTLQTNTDASLGNDSGALTFNGGTLQLLASYATSRNFIVDGGQNAIIDTQSFTLTDSGVISAGAGVGGLTKNGSGTLILDTPATYNGATTINTGTLRLGAAGVLPGIALTGGSNLVLNGSGSAAGTLDLNGFDTTLTGVPSGSGGAITSSSGSPTLSMNTGGTYSGLLTGSLSLLKAGSGTLQLNGANTYTGLTTISNGTLVLNSNSTTPDSTGYTLGDSNTGSNNVTLQLAGGFNSTDITPTTENARLLDVTVSNQGTGTATVNVASSGNNTDLVMVINRATTIKGPENQLFSSISGPGAGAGNTSLTIDVNGGNFVYTTNGTANTYSGNVLIMNSSTNAGQLQTQNDTYLANDAAHQNLVFPATASVTVNSNITWALVWGDQTIDGLNGAGKIIDNSGTNYLNNLPLLTVGAAGGSGTFSGIIGNSGGLFAFAKTGAGTQILSGANTYTGSTRISGGILSVGILANGGAASGIGESTNAAASLILDGGTLQYTGGTQSTDRLFTVTANGGTIDAAGSGALSILGNGSGSADAIAFSGSGTQTLTLTSSGGTNTSPNVFAPVIGDGSGGSTSLVLSGGATWTLTGANTYSGTTSISAGTLALSSASGNNIASSPSIRIAGGANLDTTQLASGTLTLGSGATAQTLAGPSSGTGTLTGSLRVFGAGSGVGGGTISATTGGTLAITGGLAFQSGSVVEFTLPSSQNPSTPLITVGGTLTPASGGNASLTITNGSIPYGVYDLINASSGLSSAANFTLTNTAPSGYTFQLVAQSNQLDLLVLTPITWTGQGGATWDTTTTDWAGGVPLGLVNFINGAQVTFADTNPLAAPGTLVSGSGLATITVQAGGVSPASILFTNTGASNGGVDYSIGGGPINGSTGITLYGAGGVGSVGGTVTLTSANAFTGPVAIDAGQLVITNGGALGSSSAVTVASGGALTLESGISVGAIPLTINGTGFATSPAGALNSASGSNTYGGLITLAAGSTINSATNGTTLTLTGGISAGSNPLTFTGLGNTTVSTAGISGSGGLTYNGAGTLTLAATNSYSGPVQVNTGTLRLSGSLAVGSAVTIGGSSASGTPTLAGGGPIYGSLTDYGTGSGAAGHLAPSGFTGSSGTTLQVGGSLTLDSGSVLDFNLSSSPDGLGTPPSTENDHISVGGSLALLGGGKLNINALDGVGVGTYQLIDYNPGSLSGPVTSNLSSWSVGTGAQSQYTYSFSTSNPGQFDLVVSTSSNSAVWSSNGTAGSNSLQYDAAGNWLPAAVPSGAGAIATFGNSGLTNPGITVAVGDSDVVGALIFNNASSTEYTLSGGSLTLNNNGAGPSVTVSSGSVNYPAISTPLTLADGNGSTTTFNVASGSYIDVSGAIGETASSGQKILLNGGGSLELDGVNTYTGGTTVSDGTLIVNTPSATLGSGPLAINGSSSNVMVTSPSLTVGSLSGTGEGQLNVASTTTLTVNQTTSSTFNGTLTLSGGLVLAGASGNTLTISGAPTLGSGSSITVSSGTLALTNNTNSQATVLGTPYPTVSVAPGATLQLAGSSNVLSSAVNITTRGSGLTSDGALSVVGASTQTVGVVTGVALAGSVTTYSGNTTVGDGTIAANLTATQILQNTLTINAGSTVTIAPSGSGIPADAVAARAAVAGSDAASSAATAGGDSSSDPFTAIEAAMVSGSISSAKGQQLENRIAAIDRLAATDPGLDVSLLEDHVLAALPAASVWSSSGVPPLGESASGLLAMDSNSLASSTSSTLSGAAAFAPAAAFGGSPAAVPEPSTLLLAAMGGIGILMAFRRRSNFCEQ